MTPPNPLEIFPPRLSLVRSPLVRPLIYPKSNFDNPHQKQVVITCDSTSRYLGHFPLLLSVRSLFLYSSTTFSFTTMSRPPINPEKSNAGIIVDPQTLERVIPESRRADGSVRKQLKVRPGFTPQEDVKRFRGTRQAQMDANALPKGHIIGWIAPSSASQPAKPLSKSAKKNAKRKEKREEKKANATTDEPVRDNWEDEDEDEDEVEEESAVPKASQSEASTTTTTATKSGDASEHTADKPNATNIVSSKAIQKLAADLNKLNVK
ncbi:hypothetical protein NP233_g3061 [Leucocoprinus birnbaumii]|uniref:WIBG Mago-binding domain-containing protein n=1 Tax=Leucocoprinus birnbaumii TaxID=56174 RepID=A0AAD5W3M1_9AGAR|nr:hypothetical protein NP233_g3061 [Leucocoprinus birnbaumii]